MTKPRRHHYLPVFLLSNFEIPGGRRMARVRGLRAGGAFEAGVRDVGIETDFHDDSGLFRDPEGMLSKWEGEFAKDIKRWGFGPLDDKGRATIDRLIPHLRLRSRTLRELAAKVMACGLAATERGILKVVSDSRPPLSLRDQLGAVLDEAALQARDGVFNAASRDVLLDAAAKRAVEQHVAHWSIHEAARLCGAILSENFAGQMLTGAHTMVILTTLMNQRKFEAFGECSWELLQAKGDTLLLGDVGPLCWYYGQNRLKPLYATAAPMRAVFLPLGPDRVVVGWHGERPALPSVGLLNQATIELSHEFIVGTWPLERMNEQRSRLAGRTNEDTPETILGIQVDAEVPFVQELARAMSSWAAARVNHYWRGSDPTSPAGRLLQ